MHKCVSPVLAEKLVLDLERGADRPLHETLSDREFEVLRMIASGKTVGEVAEILSYGLLSYIVMPTPPGFIPGGELRYRPLLRNA